MKQKIFKLCEKADEFNRLRMKSAEALMGANELNVFHSIPLLLHFNIPSLPGYSKENVPSGICKFIPEPSHNELMKKVFNSHLPEISNITPDIIGLYAMGSTSSIGQCKESDFDIWVCYPHKTPESRVKLLESKCTKITKWAADLGVELNFFLIPDNKFSVHSNTGLTVDACGSSQHLLLLDEFYRTSLHIAGKRILWHQIPIKYEHNYDKYVQTLYKNGDLDPNDWLDLGGFQRIPAEEYFGATLWQLYKGIDSPHKAVLKTLVMEAYSWEYPNTELIAIRYKKYFQSQSKYDENLDPYCLMLEKVTKYLIEIDDLKRLEIVRGCFYLKTNEHLSQNLCDVNTACRRTLLSTLINKWGWTNKQLVDLDDRKFWKASEVRTAKNVLLDALMISYRNLLSFARNYNICESISAEDLGVLSRKLYAAHENLPGKVEFINPNIVPDLFEEHLSFIQVPENRKHESGWYLYNCSLDNFDLLNTKCLFYTPYLSKLVAWCYINGLYKEKTKVHLYNQGSDLVDKNLLQFNKDLMSVFPIKVKKASNQELCKPCEIKQLAIFLNVERDPTRHWQDTVESTENQAGDIFSYGENNECLIGSIDFIYRNSWNEVRTLHFKNTNSVVNALNTILSKMHQDALPPQQIDVFSYSHYFSDQICETFRSKLNEFIHLRLNSTSQRSVQTLWTGGRKFGFYFERKGVTLQHLESALDMYTHISKEKISNNSINLKNTHFEQTVKIIESHISEGLIQFFFENYSQGFSVYIVNAENEVETFQNFSGSKDDLVQNVNRFYASNSSSDQINFNLPQFYDIKQLSDKTLSLSPFRSQFSQIQN